MIKGRKPTLATNTVSSHVNKRLRSAMGGAFVFLNDLQNMKVEEQIIKRLDELIQQGKHLRQGNSSGGQLDRQHGEECQGWLAPTQNLIHSICPNPANAYRVQAEKLIEEAFKRGLLIPSSIGDLTELLFHLRDDLTKGLLGTLVDRIRAEDFDNFIDQAQYYVEKGSKNEAGAIAGVVFEDTIRQVCEKNGIVQKDQKLENLINDLARRKIITALQSKRAKVASHVRTKATHAQWEEFDLAGVNDTISITREIIASKLDG